MTMTVGTTTPTPAAAPIEALIALPKLSVAPETVRRTDRRGGVEGLAENSAVSFTSSISALVNTTATTSRQDLLIVPKLATSRDGATPSQPDSPAPD